MKEPHSYSSSLLQQQLSKSQIPWTPNNSAVFPLTFQIVARSQSLEKYEENADGSECGGPLEHLICQVSQCHSMNAAGCRPLQGKHEEGSFLLLCSELAPNGYLALDATQDVPRQLKEDAGL